MQNSFNLLNEYHKPVVDSLKDMNLGALRIVSSTMEYTYICHIANISSGNHSSEAYASNEMKLRSEGRDYFKNALETYDSLTKSSPPEERKHVHTINESWMAFFNRSDEFLEIQKTDASPEEIFEAKERFEASENVLLKSINSAIEMEIGEIKETEEKMDGVVSDAVRSTWIAFIVLAFIAVVSLSTVSYSITRPVERLRLSALEIGKGNLDAKIAVSSKDEIGDLAAAFNKMATDLKTSRGEILLRTNEAEVSKHELESRVRELTETKSAMLNMMEDVEETNRELVKAHEKLNANIKALKALDTKKDEFISIAAHELKTPLTAIHGFSQLLENDDVVKNAEMRNNYLKVIDSETERLSNLVTEVLDLSRIDLGVIKFTSDSINLYGLIEQIRGETEVKAKEKNLALTYELEKGLPNIIADREKLIQMIINLVTNAEKYTEKGSIKVKIQKAGDSVQFSVADTGIGIPKKHFSKIFTRFYQVDASYTRKVGGTGLGLSVCKGFAEGMGGKIWFESTVGKGSTFHFSLPINKKKSKKLEG